jgi:hypothetical protein
MRWLVAVDGSENADLAFLTAVDHVVRHNKENELFVISVMEPLETWRLRYPGPLQRNIHSINRLVEVQHRNYLHHYVSRAHDRGT